MAESAAVEGNPWPDKIFGYVSVRSHDGVSVLQADDLSPVESFYGSPANKQQARKRIDDLDLQVIAESDLGFAVAGTKAQWNAFGEGNLKTFERMMYTRTGRRQYVTHIGIGREGAGPADDLTGRIPASASNAGVDLLVIDRPRAALSVFPTPIPPTVDRFHLRVPDDVALLLGATEAHRRGFRGDGVTVAMVDTGWSRHPFFDAREYRIDTPVTCVPGTDPERDPHGHGTGESANVFAVAPDATLKPFRAADDNGHLVATLAAFMRAKQSGAKVITNSWGGDYPYPDVPAIPYAADRILELEIRDAIAKGIVVVFSAGNGNFTMEAQIPGVIAAGGVYADAGQQLRATPYASGYRSEWYHRNDDEEQGWVRVPTVCGLVGLPPRAAYIMLPVPDGCRIDMERATAGRDDPPDGTSPFDGWALFSGTSAAAPQVAGAAAVLLGIDPDASPQQISDLLCETATDVRAGRCHPRFDFHAGVGPDRATGDGLVNLSAAVRRLEPRASGRRVVGTSDRDRLIDLVSRLATDEDGFRAKMETDPAAALREVGLEGVEYGTPVRLRPKREYQQTLKELRRGEPFDLIPTTRRLISMHS